MDVVWQRVCTRATYTMVLSADQEIKKQQQLGCVLCSVHFSAWPEGKTEADVIDVTEPGSSVHLPEGINVRFRVSKGAL